MTITGPEGIEFSDSAFYILPGQTELPYNFGSWSPGASLTSYEIDFDVGTFQFDPNVCNNDITGESFVVMGNPGVTEDFESDNGGYQSSDPSVWQWGVDSNTGTPPSSGVNVWGTVLNDNYPDLACASLTGPAIAVPVDTGGALVLSAWYEMESGWDYCNIKVSTDSSNWTIVNPFSGYDSYDAHSPDNLCGLLAGQYGFSSENMGYWHTLAFDLSSYAGHTIWFRIDFASGEDNEYFGFYLDDVYFLTYPEPRGCAYIVGDINASGRYNGLDITYGVAFFQGGSSPHCPFGSCQLSPCNSFYYCGDINGSCSYNGLDITYGVAYLKGGNAPVPCGACPPLP